MEALEKEAGRIILIKDEKEKYTYHVEETSKNKGPWFEGTTFYPDKAPEGHLKSIDGHYFGMMRHVNGDGTYEKIVRLAHTEEELNKKLHEAADNYCSKLAQELGKVFEDHTLSNPFSPELSRDETEE